MESTFFEQRIARIQELTKKPGVTVTWNDHIPDPDNPSQRRQIDISLRGPEGFTIIECRMHKEKQDVKWIEEIIGRCLSFQADMAIAVSDSGFTSGAILKAQRFGILLRDLQKLTDDEILSWGGRTKANLIYLRFSKPQIFVTIATQSEKKLAAKYVLRDGENVKSLCVDIIKAASDRIGQEYHNSVIPDGIQFFDRLELPNRTLCGSKIVEILLKASTNTLAIDVDVPSVITYGSPDEPYVDRRVHLERLGVGRTEITRNRNDAILFIDVTKIDCPQDSILVSFNFDFGSFTSIRKCELLGELKMKLDFPDINFNWKSQIKSK